MDLPDLLSARRATAGWAAGRVFLQRGMRLLGLPAPGGMPHWPRAAPLLPPIALGEGVEQVALFATCIGRALPHEVERWARGLAARGLRVEVVGQGCCGRESWAEGALDLADRESLDTLLRLVERVKRGATVLTLEQGCLSFLQGYRQRLPGIEADLLSAHSDSLLGFLLRREGAFPPPPPATGVTLHVGCRFPADLVGPAVERLGGRVTVVAGCAGGHRLAPPPQSAADLQDLAGRLSGRPLPLWSTCPLAAWRLGRLGIPSAFLADALLASPIPGGASAARRRPR